MGSRQRILVWDVETAPMLAYIWQAKTEYVNPNAITHESFMLTWAAKWLDEDRIFFGRLTSAEAKAQDDTRIVSKLGELVRQADVAVAHNGDRFDVPKLNTRLLLQGQEPLGPVRTIDTLKKAKSTFRFASNKLDYIAQQLGVGAKLPTGFDLWVRAYHGEAKALREMDHYCRQDVKVLEGVFNKMRPYVKGLPRLIDAGHEGEMACPNCGSDHLQSRGYDRTNASTFRRFQCQDCRRWCRHKAGNAAPRLATRPIG